MKVTFIRHLHSDNIQQWDNQISLTRTDKQMTNFRANDWLTQKGEIEMAENNMIKCTVCDSRDLDHDEARGEVVCNDCGTVLDTNQIDTGHPSGQVGENAHMSAQRNDSVGAKTTRRTHFCKREARKTGHGNIIRVDQRAHSQRNVRANEILDEIKIISGSNDVARAAAPILRKCYTKEGEGDGHGKLPLNQMRFVGSKGKDKDKDKDATYVIRVSAIATMKILSEHGKIPYQYWHQDADRLGIDRNDVTETTRIIKSRLVKLFGDHVSSINPKDGMRNLRRNTIEAFEQKLREYTREHNIAHAEKLLKWFTERINVLDSDGEGPMAQEKPRMLLAMITICGVELFDEVKMTKKSIAKDIFNLTVGGVNSRLKGEHYGLTKKQFIKKFNGKGNTA